MMYKMKRVMMMFVAVAIATGAAAQQGTLESGIKMYNYKKLQSAENILTPLAASDAQANYYLGLTYLSEGDIAKASATFAKYPDDPANISGMARVAFASKDVAKGMQIAKDLAAKSRKKEWIQEKYAADAITYSEGGDYNQAQVWYKDAITKNDNNDLHIGLGDVYRKTPGGGGEAMNNYEHVTEKEPNNSLALSRIGDLWYEARNYPSALENYEKAKAADNSNPLPYKALADAYTRSGRYKQALENIQKYYDLSDKTLNDKMENLKALYLAQSYCDAAKSATEVMNGQQLSGDNKIQVYGILGFSQAECGDSVAALSNVRTYLQLQRADKIKPGDYIQFGKLFLKLGQLDSAGVYYTKGISGDTAQNKTDVYRDIAEAFKAKKDYCKSADWYDNLVKANPATQPADYVWRGIMYYYCKNLNSAMTAFTDFATKYPDQPSAYYWQGRTAAAIDSEATSGAAVPYFTKWLDLVGPSYDKKNDLKGAYEYMLYYFYNKKDKDNLKLYKEKIQAIDPTDKVLSQIEELEKAPAGGGKKPAGKK